MNKKTLMVQCMITRPDDERENVQWYTASWFPASGLKMNSKINHHGKTWSIVWMTSNFKRTYGELMGDHLTKGKK